MLLCKRFLSSLCLKVDNSAPTPGAFAISTSHSTDLERHRDGYMTYEGRIVKLAFIGFADPHTDIEKYYITIGINYSGNDLIGVTYCLAITQTYLLLNYTLNPVSYPFTYIY